MLQAFQTLGLSNLKKSRTGYTSHYLLSLT